MCVINKIIAAVSLLVLPFAAFAQDSTGEAQVIEERPVIDPFLQENSIETLTLETLADPDFDPNQIQFGDDRDGNEGLTSDGLQNQALIEDNLLSTEEVGTTDPDLIPLDEPSLDELDRLLGNEPPAAGFNQGVIETRPLEAALEQPASTEIEPPEDFQSPDLQVVDANGAILRGLDTLNGTVRDFTINVAQTLEFERLHVTLYACRYPDGDIRGEAYAYLQIRDKRESSDRFSGWMLASSPALSALDHPRYDIWVLSCKTD